MRRAALLTGTLLLGPGCSADWLRDILLTKRHPYEQIYGYERFEYAFNVPDDEKRYEENLDCYLVWAVTGTPRTIPETCVGCEFVFDVELLYDAGPYAGTSWGGGAGEPCEDLAGDGYGYTYGYSKRYEALMVSYGDVYYLQWLKAAWIPDEDDDDRKPSGTLVYGDGVRNVDLYGYDLGDNPENYMENGYYKHYTYYWYGVLRIAQDPVDTYEEDSD